MPIIDGVKMACGPCIRGHRSTKCQHSGERLLVPVRKPGRPLSVCPHPSDKACGCGVVTAAIPRSKKCGCSTSSANVSAPDKPTLKTELSDLVPDLKSPTSPIKRNFSIQKSTPKQTTKLDPALLERTDAAYVNVRPAGSWDGLAIPPNQQGFMMGMPAPGVSVPFTPPVSNGMVNGFHQPTTAAPYNSQGYIMTATTQQQMMAVPLSMVPPAMMSPDNSPISGSHQRNGSVGMGPSIPTNTGGSGSCCTPKATPQHSPSSSTTSATALPKSCCSGSKSRDGNDDIQQTVNGNYANGPHTQRLHNVQVPGGGGHHTNGTGMHVFGPSLNTEMGFPAGFYHQPPGPAIYTYPASYGTMQSPLLPAQWRQTMSAHYAMAMPHQHDLAQQPPVLPYQPAEADPAVGEGVSHACSCGDSCNCLGCPAHPYNEATQGMVRSAMSSMLDDSADKVAAPGSANGSAVAGTAPSSPTPAHTPASEKSEDQVQATASDFFFVSYPNLCDGAENTCPCGDDCQCLGCFFHGNSATLESEVAGAVGGQ